MRNAQEKNKKQRDGPASPILSTRREALALCASAPALLLVRGRARRCMQESYPVHA
jgi:hypothetical protein